MTFARLDAFARGQISALARQGQTSPMIRKAVRKKDGQMPSDRAVRGIVAKALANPKWRGEHGAGPGRPATISAKVLKRIVKIVFKERGSKIVTTKYIKKKVPAVRRVPRWTVARALHSAGLQWLRRRKKRFLRQEHRLERMDYARWVKARGQAFLKTFAYIDGTTFYLARGADEASDQKQQRLGSFVWRMSTSADGLYHDNVGASLYASKQGKPVKVWGFLANGRLSIYVLPANETGGTEHMNGPRFREMMCKFGRDWKRKSWPTRAPKIVHLVQDHERCLWQKESLDCLKSLGMPAIECYPRNSPDLNAIEEVWSHMRTYLEERAPTAIETRSAFTARLRGAVAHLNGSKRGLMLKMCRDQADRAEQVLKLTGAHIDR